MTIFYAADLTYVTRAGTKLTAHQEFIDFTDVMEYTKQVAEFLADYDYTLMRCDINRVTKKEEGT